MEAVSEKLPLQMKDMSLSMRRHFISCYLTLLFPNGPLKLKAVCPALATLH